MDDRTTSSMRGAALDSMGSRVIRKSVNEMCTAGLTLGVYPASHYVQLRKAPTQTN